MKILVLNAGSGSQKFSLYEVDGDPPVDAPEPLWCGEIDNTALGQPEGSLFVTVQPRGQAEVKTTVPDDRPREERIATLLKTLWEGGGHVLGEPQDIDLVSHRVVHGEDEFDQAVLVEAKVEAAIERLAAFAPLHNASNLDGIRVAREVLGAGTPQAAVFDTAFHRTLSEAAATYAGPREWLDQGIRRYGFHGTSFRYAAAKAARLLGRNAEDPELKLVVCHLGGGCSLAAVRGGQSVDTTMASLLSMGSPCARAPARSIRAS